VAELQLVVFRLAGEQFAAPITRVREILRPLRVTRMPRVASYVKGLFNLRGQVLPLLDSKARLGLGAATPADLKDPRARVMVVEAQGENVGVMVDEVMEVLRCTDEDLQSPSNVLDLPAARFLESVLDMEGRLVLVLDLDRLIEGAAASDEPAAVEA
jgi:chemotaxis signal transduction protein